MTPILDMTAGSRMFWWNKHNPLTTFLDRRREIITVPDRSHREDGTRTMFGDKRSKTHWLIFMKTGEAEDDL